MPSEKRAAQQIPDEWGLGTQTIRPSICPKFTTVSNIRYDTVYGYVVTIIISRQVKTTRLTKVEGRETVKREYRRERMILGWGRQGIQPVEWCHVSFGPRYRVSN